MIMCSRILSIASLLFLYAVFSLGRSETVIRRRIHRSPALWDSIGLPTLPPSFPTLPSMDSIREGVNNNVETLTEGLDKASEMGKATLTKIQDLIEEVRERVAALEKSVLPDEVHYWEESNQCGGVLVSQTGRISYKPDRPYEHHEKCVWTVRSNYRSKIKILMTTRRMENVFDRVTVTEMDRDGNKKMTRLNPKQNYVFDGSLIFVTFTSDGYVSGYGFNLEFEGIGRNINTDITYRNMHFNSTQGTFDYDTLKTSSGWKAIRLPSIMRAPSTEFLTVVVNPISKNDSSLKLTIDASTVNLQPEECEKASVTFHDLVDPQAGPVKCCGINCDEVTSSGMVNDDGFLLSIGKYQAGTSQQFGFTWTVEDKKRTDSVDKCGGTITGHGGSIAYKNDVQYNNNERCVWTITPLKHSTVKVLLRNEGFEDGYDHLTVSSWDTKLAIQNQRIEKSIVYNFTGPTVILTFYSDNSLPGKGFLLEWGESGDGAIHVNAPLLYEFESGALELSLDPDTYQIAVLNPKYNDGSSLRLNLNTIEIGDSPANGNCGTTAIFLYGNDEDGFSNAQNYMWQCENGKEVLPEEFQTVGGVFIFLFYSETQEIRKVDVSWRKGETPRTLAKSDVVFAESKNDSCGGILVGDAGEIEYKLSTAYEGNARCTWIVETSQHSKISFKLTKDGFESCCDFLIVTPLDIHSGKLGESVIINRENKIRSFSSPVVFITFYSDHSLGNHGFRLEFTTSGTVEDSDQRPRFIHRIWHQVPAEASFESANETDTVYEQWLIVTNVLSPIPQNNGNEITPILVEADILHFQTDSECRSDSLLISEIQNPTEENNRQLAEAIVCETKDANNCPCLEKQRKMSLNFTTSAFISVFKTKVGNDANIHLIWNKKQE